VALGGGDFALGRGFGEGAGSKDPVTEPKRSPRAKRPPSLKSQPGATALLEML